MDKATKIKLSSQIALIAGLAAVFTALILLLNFFQMQSGDPLNEKTEEALVQALKENPNNEELKEHIRTVDLMARKAFFTKQWQVKTGSYLLLAFAVVALIALRSYFSLQEEKTAPDEKLRNQYLEGLSAHKWIMAGVAVLFISALLTAFISNKNYRPLSAQTIEKKEIDEPESNQHRMQKPEAENMPDTTMAITKNYQTRPDTAKLNSGAETLHSDTASIEPVVKKQEEKESYASLSTIKRQHASFRGPLGQGMIYAEDIPTDWDVESGKNMLWKKPVPQAGYNSPIIWGDRLFIAGGDYNSRNVYCYNKNNGVLIWEKEVKNVPGAPAEPPKTTDDTGLAAPTMTTDGNRVYAIFGTGNIIAFTMEGEQVWARNLGVPDNHYGHSSSLMNWQGKLFVQYDTQDGGRVLALDAKTGKTIWDKSRDAKISWASPILATINGKMQLVLSSNPIVAGHDLESGSQLWSVNCMMGEVGPSPAFYDGMIIAANEYARLVAINPASQSIKWETMDYMPEVASPVVANGVLFIATSYGVLAGFDVQSGELLWEQDYDNGFYSSPVAVGNRVYMFDMGGNCHIVQASKTFKQVATHAMGEKVFGTPAFSNGRIYVRGEKHLFCIGK